MSSLGIPSIVVALVGLNIPAFEQPSASSHLLAAVFVSGRLAAGVGTSLFRSSLTAKNLFSPLHSFALFSILALAAFFLSTCSNDAFMAF